MAHLTWSDEEIGVHPYFPSIADYVQELSVECSSRLNTDENLLKSAKAYAKRLFSVLPTDIKEGIEVSRVAEVFEDHGASH